MDPHPISIYSRLTSALGSGLVALSLCAATTPALTQTDKAVKIGVLLGFTGPIESLIPPMADSADLAFKQVSDSGQFLDGKTIESVRADSTCIDAGAATAAAERLVTSEKVVAILGADCSGVTIAVANNVAVPKGIALISPSATSPALSTIDDDGLFFRTSPSDARQGKVLAQVIKERGYDTIAITYTKNDYGKGLSESLQAGFEALGGTVAISTAHEDGKGDYTAEVAELAEAGSDLLVVLGYADQGGIGIVRAALDTGAFEIFGLGDAMYSPTVLDSIKADGNDLTGSFGTVPGNEGEGVDAFQEIVTPVGLDGQGPFTGESYDAAALMALAMQRGGEATSEAIAANMIAVANAPGEKILPGQLDKALKILAAGGEVDYVGVTNVELVGPGEAAGSYREYEVQGDEFKTVRFR
ncbi:ABC transporter substrate-binding protein [Candidatus Synechococcus spongiarum]|uniref:Branched-chain amino acid ABC transporter, amino acid-binding protein (TC 3.A.1.4.1) n=1 Tax=Candidatus Synechococcus spongiarum TaxID=431041 RepID=A0A165AH43_9SYNE|nr:ABC transporter substrate-binding protein [Candidatus Synechococcus spongiarum]SAY39994.1 Branched-chain amino acid ABC transporter, amino acid-binding protein (TC 3.A.1.4.1) [Candidatus Synechococcus spongiarum]